MYCVNAAGGVEVNAGIRGYCWHGLHWFAWLAGRPVSWHGWHESPFVGMAGGQNTCMQTNLWSVLRAGFRRQYLTAPPQ
jgi:hypothetical protein